MPNIDLCAHIFGDSKEEPRLYSGGFLRFRLSEGPTNINKQEILYEFVSASNLPPAGYIGGLKNDKKMWHDENEWKEWKKKMKR